MSILSGGELQTMKRNQLLTNKIVSWAKWFVQQEVKPGEICVDATVGNGNDTLFLAALVGPSGRVYGFDIQEAALEITRQRLVENGFLERVCLIQDSHACIGKYLKPGTAKVVMFNLGYLPGGDHSLTTLPGSTLQALDAALQLIKQDGLITVVCYRGHEGALTEFTALNEFLAELNPKFYNVLRLDLINRPNLPPVLFVISKKHGKGCSRETARS